MLPVCECKCAYACVKTQCLSQCLSSCLHVYFLLSQFLEKDTVKQQFMQECSTIEGVSGCGVLGVLCHVLAFTVQCVITVVTAVIGKVHVWAFLFVDILGPFYHSFSVLKHVAVKCIPCHPLYPLVPWASLSLWQPGSIYSGL